MFNLLVLEQGTSYAFRGHGSLTLAVNESLVNLGLPVFRLDAPSLQRGVVDVYLKTEITFSVIKPKVILGERGRDRGAGGVGK